MLTLTIKGLNAWTITKDLVVHLLELLVVLGFQLPILPILQILIWHRHIMIKVVLLTLVLQVIGSVLLVQEVLLLVLVDVVLLGKHDSMKLLTEDGELDPVSDKVRAFRDLEELCVLVAISELADEPPLDLILPLSSLVVRIFPGLELFGSVCASTRQSILIDEQVRSSSTLVEFSSSASLLSLLESFLVGFDLPHGLHEVDALSEKVGLLTCLSDVGEVFVELVKVRSKVHVLSLLRQVHEEVENSCLILTIECFLKVVLDGSSDGMGPTEVLGVPVSVRLGRHSAGFTDSLLLLVVPVSK